MPSGAHGTLVVVDAGPAAPATDLRTTAAPVRAGLAQIDGAQAVVLDVRSNEDGAYARTVASLGRAWESARTAHPDQPLAAESAFAEAVIA